MATPIKVVLIDDFELMRTGLKLALNDHADIRVAGDTSYGKTGLNLIKAHHPDIVIMEMNLCDMTFDVFIRSLYQINKKARVLVISDLVHEDYAKQALKLGVHGYVSKKQEFDNLVQAIRRVHAGEHVFSEDVSSTLFATLVESARAGKLCI